MYVFFQSWEQARTFLSWYIHLKTCFPWRRDSMALQFSLQTIFSGVERQYSQLNLVHCEKIVQIRSSFWSVFSCFTQSEYRKIRTRNKYVFGYFSCSGSNWLSIIFYLKFKMTAFAFEKMQKNIVIPW